MNRIGQIFYNLWRKNDFFQVVNLDLGSFYTKLVIDDVHHHQLESSYLKHKSSGSVVKIGQQTLDYYERCLPQLELIMPFKRGGINHKAHTQEFLQPIFSDLSKSAQFGLKLPNTMVRLAVSPLYSTVQRQVIRDTLQRIGVVQVEMIDKLKAIYQTAMPNPDDTASLLIVDVGAQTTLMGLCSGGVVIDQGYIAKGSLDFNRVIQRQVKQKYQCQIGFKTAEKIKKEICRLVPVGQDEMQLAVRGKDVMSSLPKTIVVTSGDFEEELVKLAAQISDRLLDLIAHLSFDDMQAVTENGVYMTGGGSLLKGWGKFLEKKIKVNANFSKSPFLDVVKGIGLCSKTN